MLTEFLGYLNLFGSLYFSIRGKPEKARKKLDKALSRMSEREDFVDAYDARIMMMEGRHEEARKKLSSVIASLRDRTDEDASYIRLYCQFFLALYQASAESRIVKARASQLTPDSNLMSFLPFFSDDAISRILKEKLPTEGFPFQAAKYHDVDLKVSIEL